MKKWFHSYYSIFSIKTTQLIRPFLGSPKGNLNITKTCLYNFDPLKPHFYIVTLGFTGIYIIFLICAQNIDCGYSLELPHWGSSTEYPQYMFWAEIWKISELLSENFQFLVVKFSIYLNRRVFVMITEFYCICSFQLKSTDIFLYFPMKTYVVGTL